MKHTAEVVVIGAGVQGLSAAYHLAALGIRDVVVVEQAFIGAGSSGRSASMLMLQVWTEWQVRFSQYCFERFIRFEDEFGVSPEYHRIGTLSLATHETAPEEQALQEMREGLGVTCERWSTEEIRRRFPAIHADDLAFGVYGAEDGVIEAQSIMMGYQTRARELGVEICQGARAAGIRHENGRIAAVETTDGVVQTRWVVNAAGADAALVGSWVGIDIPIANRVRNVFVTDAFPSIPDDACPFVWDAATEWYFRKEHSGLLIGTGKRKLPAAADGIDWTYLDEVFDRVVHRLPGVAEVGIAYGWSGMRSLSPDHRPILGPVDGVPGFVNSCGWGGEGIMHSPIGGQLVAETIAYGAARTFPMEPFLLSRFATPS
ncbi:MAG: FAD-binding oxidoreductase [Chloroflexi bacterium]|nr:FAD-binding oxidoreductase [Chloroflexota bacterium]